MELLSVFAIVVVVLGIVLVLLGVKVVPQGMEYTVERFGRYTTTLTPVSTSSRRLSTGSAPS